MRDPYLRVLCTKKPATMAIVVGRLAAHTPSLFKVFSSVCVATTNGGAHCKNKSIDRNWHPFFMAEDSFEGEKREFVTEVKLLILHLFKTESTKANVNL